MQIPTSNVQPAYAHAPLKFREQLGDEFCQNDGQHDAKSIVQSTNATVEIDTRALDGLVWAGPIAYIV